jgi:L-fucose/D-arabinose isomerase
MARVGVLTVSDGRRAVHEEVGTFGLGVEERLTAALTAAGHEVVRAQSDVWSNETAVAEARRIADVRPDLAIINIPVWAFPHFSMLAARELIGPLLLFSSLDPQYPGMVGMLAAGGSLDQIGRVHGRAWGDISDPDVLRRVDGYVRAGAAVRAL